MNKEYDEKALFYLGEALDSFRTSFFWNADTLKLIVADYRHEELRDFTFHIRAAKNIILAMQQKGSKDGVNSG